MTRSLSLTPAARPRWRAIVATLALVGALITSSAASATADVVGTGPGTISGTVTTPDGLPIAGVQISAAFAGSTQTDANGYYELSGLELLEQHIYVWSAGYQQSSGGVATLTAAAPIVTLDFVLAPFETGVGTISGQVTADGLPLAGKQVSAWENFSGANAYATTDENGFYEITDLANGQWNVYIFGGEDYQPVFIPSFDITDAAPNAHVDLALLSWPVGAGSISGVLTDSETGEAIVGAYFYSTGLDVPHNSVTTSEASGAFSFENLPEGTYYLSLNQPGYLGFSQEVHVLDGQAVALDLALIPTNATISGHVAGANGIPAVGLNVSATAGTGFGTGTLTDSNGDYVIHNVGATEYTVSVGGVGTPFQSKQQVVTPIAHGDVTVDFTLANRTTAYLSGYVVDENGEWFSGAVCATLYSAKNKKPLANVATYGPEFGDGTYTFPDLKPGAYTVEFRDCDDDPATKFEKVFLGGVKNFKDATLVTIVAGQDSWENVVTIVPRGNKKK